MGQFSKIRKEVTVHSLARAATPNSILNSCQSKYRIGGYFSPGVCLIPRSSEGALGKLAGCSLSFLGRAFTSAGAAPSLAAGIAPENRSPPPVLDAPAFQGRLTGP